MLFLTAHALALVGPALRGPRQHLLLGSQPPHHLRVIQSITGLAAETKGGSTASAEQAAEMELLAGMLEQQNRCKEPATTAPSPIDGEWDQVYTDNPVGITFGNGKLMRRKLLGPFRGRVTQLVDTAAPSAQYRQRIQTWAGLLRGELKVDVTAAGPSSWDVSFDCFTVSLLRRLPLRSRPAAYQGTWSHTYVDADTRVMRTAKKGGGQFLFILRRRR